MVGKRANCARSEGDGLITKRALFAFMWSGKTKKNTFFQKRTGEVVENTKKLSKNEPERT